MKIDLGAAFAAAWALARRDRDVLTGIAGLFVFLPALATLVLLTPPPPAPQMGTGADEGAVAAWVDAYVAWSAHSTPLLAVSVLASLFGSLTITALYLDNVRPTVAGAMLTAARLFPRYVLLMLGVSVVALVGMALFVLPGLWVMGRTMLVTPALVAERRAGSDQAPGPISRSIDLTRGNGLLMAGLAGIGTFGAQLLMGPFLAISDAMTAAGAANPIAVVLADIGAAIVATAFTLGVTLIRVTIYSRSALPRIGI